MTGVRRRYVDLPTGQVHLRQAGSPRHGGPAVLLHDAPGSSAAWACSLERLAADELAAVAVDLLGVGGTTVDPHGAGDLTAQARAVLDTMTALGIDRAPLVGQGAGAAVALAAAELDPRRVAAVVVDEPPYSGADAPPEWDPCPSRHGEHLVRLWHEVRDAATFRPWWLPTAAARRRRRLSDPAVLHAVVADIAGHGDAHRRLAAAAAQGWRRLADTAPVPLLDLPPDDPAALAAVLRDLAGASAAGKVPPAPPPSSVDASGSGAPRALAGTVRRTYVDTGYGQLHVRWAGRSGGGRTPVLLLHANPGSGAGLEPLVAALGADRQAFTVDLPGHGRSDALPESRRDGADLGGCYAPLLVEMLDRLGLDRVAVYGTHTGAGLAVELALAAPERVASVVLDGVPLFDEDPDLVARVLAHYFVDLTPDTHGSHLVRAWNVTCDMGLWWPWFDHTAAAVRDVDAYPPDFVHRVTTDLLFSLPTYAVSYRAAWTWRASARLPLLGVPALVGTTPGDPLRAMTPRSLELLPAGRETAFVAAGTAGAVDANAATIRAFVDDLAE